MGKYAAYYSNDQHYDLVNLIALYRALKGKDKKDTFMWNCRDTRTWHEIEEDTM